MQPCRRSMQRPALGRLRGGTVGRRCGGLRAGRRLLGRLPRRRQWQRLGWLCGRLRLRNLRRRVRHRGRFRARCKACFRFRGGARAGLRREDRFLRRRPRLGDRLGGGARRDAVGSRRGRFRCRRLCQRLPRAVRHGLAGRALVRQRRLLLRLWQQDDEANQENPDRRDGGGHGPREFLPRLRALAAGRDGSHARQVEKRRRRGGHGRSDRRSGGRGDDRSRAGRGRAAPPAAAADGDRRPPACRGSTGTPWRRPTR